MEIMKSYSSKFEKLLLAYWSKSILINPEYFDSLFQIRYGYYVKFN